MRGGKAAVVVVGVGGSDDDFLPGGRGGFVLRGCGVVPHLQWRLQRENEKVDWLPADVVCRSSSKRCVYKTTKDEQIINGPRKSIYV